MTSIFPSTLILRPNKWQTATSKPLPRYSSTLFFEQGALIYSIQLALVDRDTHMTANYDWRDLALAFNVINASKIHFAWCLWNEPKISISEINK